MCTDHRKFPSLQIINRYHWRYRLKNVKFIFVLLSKQPNWQSQGARTRFLFCCIIFFFFCNMPWYHSFKTRNYNIDHPRGEEEPKEFFTFNVSCLEWVIFITLILHFPTLFFFFVWRTKSYSILCTFNAFNLFIYVCMV